MAFAYRSLFVAVLASLAVPAGAATAAPRNDDFAQARTVRVGTTVKGNINGATGQRGEPRHANSLAGRSVWYRFRAKREVTVGLSTCRTSFDSVIAVYRGRSLRNLREVEFNNGGCGNGEGSRVTFTARRGRTYRIAVAGFTSGGRFRLEVARIPVPANDDFAHAARLRIGSPVTATTQYATREIREPRHSFGHAHTVWFRLAVDTAGVVRLDACDRSGPGIAVYAGRRVSGLSRIPVATRTLGSQCSVQFAAQPGIAYRLAVENGDNGVGAFRLRVRFAAPQANDNFADATQIALGSTINATTRDATAEPSELEAYSEAATVWYRLDLPDTTTVRIDNCISGNIQIYSGPQLSQLTGDSRFSRCPSQATLEPGVYFIRIGRAGLREADFSFSTAAVTPPANDNFADATPITLGTTVPGTTRYATSEPFEPASNPFTVWYRLSLDEPTTVRFACGPEKVQLTDYAGVGSVTSVFCANQTEPQERKLPRGLHSIQVQSDEEVDFTFRVEAVTP